MRFLIVFFALAAVAYSQFVQSLPCGFSCTRNTVVNAMIDGRAGIATCSESTTPTRCTGCCAARALQEGIANGNSAGFLSNDQKSCVCCFRNTNRNCGNSINNDVSQFFNGR